MKWLIVLLVLVVIIGLVAYRYRKQLQTALFMYRTVQKMRKSAKQARANAEQNQMPPRDTSMDSELVACPNCGKYSAMNETVKLKGKYFCSHQCMEESLAVKRTPSEGQTSPDTN